MWNPFPLLGLPVLHSFNATRLLASWVCMPNLACSCYNQNKSCYLLLLTGIYQQEQKVLLSGCKLAVRSWTNAEVGRRATVCKFDSFLYFSFTGSVFGFFSGVCSRTKPQYIWSQDKARCSTAMSLVLNDCPGLMEPPLGDCNCLHLCSVCVLVS